MIELHEKFKCHLIFDGFFNRTWTNLSGSVDHHSVRIFQKGICVCFDQSGSAVSKLWDLICRTGTWCAACPEAQVHLPVVIPDHSSYILLAACAQEISEHALNMWDNAERCPKFTGYMCGSHVPVPCSCTRFTGLLELVTLWPVLFLGGVVQNTSILVRHLDL